jgi:hypothetical protein
MKELLTGGSHLSAREKNEKEKGKRYGVCGEK